MNTGLDMNELLVLRARFSWALESPRHIVDMFDLAPIDAFREKKLLEESTMFLIELCGLLSAQNNDGPVGH